ncbi:MAG: hypothetical protein ACOC1F_12925, partial [Myxococcota bacterium]
MKDCDTGEPCVTGSCNQQTGECEETLVPQGTGCSDGNACTQNDTCDGAGACVVDALAYDDPCWDSALDNGIPTTIAEAARFLYTDPNAVQQGVSGLESGRIAIIRGQVADRTGAALKNVRISVRNHTEFGWTSTLVRDGEAWFDMAVNGGGYLTVRYERQGYLPVERKVFVPQRDYTILPPVAMTLEGALATNQFACDSDAWQAVEEPGGGRLTLLVPPDTMWDGCSTTTDYGLRLIEYTTGTDGPDAMPALLPPTSAYTYAAEFRLEEPNGSLLSPEFSNAVISYVDNFLDFDRGTTIPSGYYDEDLGAWTQNTNGGDQAENGIVLKILSTGGGIAAIDITNDEVADDVSSIMSVDEPTQLASLVAAGVFSVGQEYWRVPIWHFSSVDYNLPFTGPPDAEGPKVTPEADNPLDKTCKIEGSIIVCETQALGERIQVPGTPYSLVYRSDRVPGYAASRTLRIPLRGSTVPGSLKAIMTWVAVAGNVEEIRHQTTVMDYNYQWNGKDVYGRKLNGAQPVTVRVGYVYDAQYTGGQNFGDPGDGVAVSAGATRDEIVYWTEWKGTLGGWDATGFGLGGWSPYVLHGYSKETQQLYRGDGSHRTAVGLGETLVATNPTYNGPNGIAFGPDGTLYVAEFDAGVVTKTSPSGTVTTVKSGLSNPADVAVAPDGRIVIVEKGADRVIRCDPDGLNEEVLVASLNNPRGVAIDAHANVYVTDTDNRQILRITAGGSVTVFAGIGESGDTGDEGSALLARFMQPWGLAVMPDGSLLVADKYAERVRRIDGNDM